MLGLKDLSKQIGSARIFPVRYSVKTNSKEARKKKKVNYSKHSESVEKINKEAKLAVTHSANVAVL